MTTGKTIALTRWTFFDKVMSLLFNMLSRLVIAFLPRSKCLLIPWLQSPSAVILEPPQIKSVTVYTVSPSICHEVMELDAMILVFWMLGFKTTFSLSSLIFMKRLFSSSSFSVIRVVSSVYLRLLLFLSGNHDSSLCFIQPAFRMIHSAYKLTKQGDNIQPWKRKWSRSVVSDSVRPHRRLPTRLHCPWDSPGKNTLVGCHFLFQCIGGKVKGKLLSHVRLSATP